MSKYRIWIKGLFLSVALICLVLLPETSFAQPEVSLQQQLFSVKPTLDLDSLERYSSKGILSSGFTRYGVPVLLFGGALVFAHVWAARKRRLQCSKKECKRSYLRVVGVGAINALGLFVVFQLIGGVLAPTSLKHLAVYVDETLTFSKGDRVRVSFDIINSGTEEATELVFRNMYSSELIPIKESIIFTKDGSLPSDYLPLVSKSELVIPIGDLAPGESAHLFYDFYIASEGVDSIQNVASVRGGNVRDIYSNSSVIRRGDADGSSTEESPEAFEQIQSEQGSALYFVDPDLTLREMETEQVDASWFADTDTATVSEVFLSAAEFGPALLPKSGTWLVRERGTQTPVYYVAPGSILRPLSESEADRIFGPGWVTEVADLSAGTLASYNVGEPIASGEYPDGLFLTDGESRCLIVNQLCRPVTESGMEENYISERFMRVVAAEVIHGFPLGKIIDGRDVSLLKTLLSGE